MNKGTDIIAAGVLLCLLLAAVVTAAGRPSPRLLDAGRVSWSELSFQASKWGLSATSDVRLEWLPTPSAATSLIVPTTEDPTTAGVSTPTGSGNRATAGSAGIATRGSGLTSGRETLLFLTLRYRLLGRDSETRLWLDPADAAALQRVILERGSSRNRYKAYRFTDQGVYTLRRSPTEGEVALPYERWSDISDTFEEYPERIRQLRKKGVIVTEASALFYIITAADLAVRGEHIEVAIFSRNRFHLAKLIVEDSERIRVEYTAESADGTRRTVREHVNALRLSVHPHPLDSRHPENGFRLAGIEEDISIFLDPDTRIPLKVKGKVRYAGTVRLRLQRVVFAS